MIKVTFDTTDAAKLIETFADGRLSNETCMELAYFLGDCWSDGIEIDRLKAIVEATTEWDSAKELIEFFYPDEPYTMIREEEGELSDRECEEKLLERLQDHDGITILRTSNGYATIE